ncbi:hypothetical protein [Methylocystis heyeri]|uniref:Uncharacterized protein n=1 Tax=Methylocystis heyeri TaxID=391905 RepID=A0A6B8KGL8_9HYPH|nr:hypothetical protein [Methylocystis heyeri]QGM45570.1 hypothetical protein H2LOC_007590 [Methylocystis heyeri]
MTERNYFRGDQKEAITAPDLSKQCEYADHIVNARGKKTAFTSVSLDRNKIEPFGEVDYLLLRQKAAADGHQIIEHEDLVAALQASASSEEKAARLKALQALRYARMRKEGLVRWAFDISGIARKDIVTWGFHRVQQYFQQV